MSFATRYMGQGRIWSVVETYGVEECDVCGEPADNEMAEVFDPNDNAEDATVCHAICIPPGYIQA